MKLHAAKTAYGYNDIQLLININTEIESRDEIDVSTKLSRNIKLKFPLVLSPMDTVSCVESCVAMNEMGAAGILHRFMSFEERIEKAKEIYNRCGRVYVAVGLGDSIDDLVKFRNEILVDCFFLDCAHGGMKKVLTWIKEFKTNLRLEGKQLITGNTQTMDSVLAHFNLSSDGIRNGIGIGSACLTTKMTGIGCSALTSNYYAWKARGQWANMCSDPHLRADYYRPTILTDGGVTEPGHLTKAIASGADAVITGRIFAGCKETPGEIVTKIENLEVDNFLPDKKVVKEIRPFEVKYKKYRGCASKSIQEEVGKDHIFVEGDEFIVPYTGKSVCEVVKEYCDGLKSAMSYLGCRTLKELKGGMWTGKVKYVIVPQNSQYEAEAHGKIQ